MQPLLVLTTEDHYLLKLTHPEVGQAKGKRQGHLATGKMGQTERHSFESDFWEGYTDGFGTALMR